MNFRTSAFGINAAAAARRAATLTVLLTLLCVMGGGAAQAFPKFSQKEKKPCSYCHVNAAGGGKRNAAGMWYQRHGLSFAGYTPEKAAQEAGGGAVSPAPKKATTGPAKPVKPSGKTAKKATAKKSAPKKPVKKK